VPIAHIDLYGCESRFLRRAIGTGVAWMIPRAALDQALREAAAEQATVWYDTVVRDLRPAETDGSWRLTIQQGAATRPLVCDGVILACGSRTRLAAPWGISGEPILGASITAYARGPDSDALLFQFIEALQPGYGWVFAMAGHRVNLGVCALRPAAVRGLRRHASAYAARWHVGQPCPWRGGAEALWSGRSQRWHHGAGIVSCGDAAGLVDPSTGEGITAALLSGQRAGAALSLYLRAGRDMRHLQDYSAWVASHFGSVYRSTPVRRLWEGLCGL
jgi:flavin-dependent dehydrogenase